MRTDRRGTRRMRRPHARLHPLRRHARRGVPARQPGDESRHGTAGQGGALPRNAPIPHRLDQIVGPRPGVLRRGAQRYHGARGRGVHDPVRQLLPHHRRILRLPAHLRLGHAAPLRQGVRPRHAHRTAVRGVRNHRRQLPEEGLGILHRLRSHALRRQEAAVHVHLPARAHAGPQGLERGADDPHGGGPRVRAPADDLRRHVAHTARRGIRRLP